MSPLRATTSDPVSYKSITSQQEHSLHSWGTLKIQSGTRHGGTRL
jgi:hypothetical protein